MALSSTLSGRLGGIGREGCLPWRITIGALSSNTGLVARSLLRMVLRSGSMCVEISRNCVARWMKRLLNTGVVYSHDGGSVKTVALHPARAA